MARILPKASHMKLLSSTILFASLAVGSFAYGQQAGQSAPPPTPSQQQSDTPTVSVTGCLVKGETNGSYVITDQQSGEKLTFPGPDQLDNYVNQTVRLTGTMSSQGSSKAFKPQRISTVSSTCQK